MTNLSNLYINHHTTTNTVLIALFQLGLQYGKGSKAFITSLLKYTCLCLPEEHNFPTTYSQFVKVKTLIPLF